MGEKTAVTIRLSSDTIEELDAEADAVGLSRSAYIRHILHQRRYTTAGPRSTHDAQPVRTHRGGMTPNTTDTGATPDRGRPDTDSDTAGGMEPNTTDTGSAPEHGRSATDPDTHPPHAGWGDDTADDRRDVAVDALTLPGNTAEIVAERRDAVWAVVNHLDAHGPAQAADIRDALYDDHDAGYQSPRSWWKNCISGALSDLRDDGWVELVHPHRGEWNTT